MIHNKLYIKRNKTRWTIWRRCPECPRSESPTKNTYSLVQYIYCILYIHRYRTITQHEEKTKTQYTAHTVQRSNCVHRPSEPQRTNPIEDICRYITRNSMHLQEKRLTKFFIRCFLHQIVFPNLFSKIVWQTFTNEWAPIFISSCHCWHWGDLFLQLLPSLSAASDAAESAVLLPQQSQGKFERKTYSRCKTKRCHWNCRVPLSSVANNERHRWKPWSRF